MRAWCGLLVLGVLLVPQLAGAIEHNAFHVHRRDEGMELNRAARVGANTTTYDLNIESTRLFPDVVYLDEIFLTLTFKDGETISADRLVEVYFDNGSERRTYYAAKFRKYNRGQEVFLTYSFPDAEEAPFTAISSGWFSSYWKLVVSGDKPLDALETYLTYHQIGSDQMPDLALNTRSLLELKGTTGPEDPNGWKDLERKLRLESARGPLLGNVPSGQNENLIVLVHGWNAEDSPGITKNMYAPCDADCSETSVNDGRKNRWVNLQLRVATNPAYAGWKVLRYDWHADATTGNGIPSAVNDPNAARDAGHAHGLKLGKLLGRLNPKTVHFVAHSAGSWVARRAAEHLRNKLRDEVVLQMTVLDPFVNDRDSLGYVLGDDFDLSTSFAMTRLWVDHLENYWTNDHRVDWCDGAWLWFCDPETSTGTDFLNWTSGEFPIEPRWDTEVALDGGIGSGNQPCFQEYMDNHSGPVAWYADTVDDSDEFCSRSTLRSSRLGFAGGSEAARTPRISLRPVTGPIVGTQEFKADVAAELAQAYAPPEVAVRWLVAGSVQGTATLLPASSLPGMARWSWQTAGRVDNGLYRIRARAEAQVPNMRTAQSRTISQEAEVAVEVANVSGGGTVGVAPDGPTNLRQYDPASLAPLAQGTRVAANRVRLVANVTDRDLEALTLEAEVQPLGVGFTSSPSSTCVAAGAVASGSDAAVTCTSLSPGSYRWQVRARDARGNAGPWRSAFPTAPGAAAFVVEAPPTGYTEGSAYRNAAGSVCRYMSGACHLLASQAVYLHFYPGDTTWARARLLPDAEYAALAATSPCRIGGDYWAAGTARGCVHVDGVSLAADAPLFVLDASATGRRIPAGALGACFDATRVAAAPGLAARFGFADSNGAPYYCTPGGSAVESCGSCKTKVSSCDASCRPSAGTCEYQCLLSEVCDAGVCKDPTSTLRAGQVTSPPCGSTIPNTGSPVTWTLGSSTIGLGTESALFCHKDGTEWYPILGYDASTTSATVPGLRPGEAFECRVRTRRSGTWSPWAESPVCRWTAASTHAQASVVSVTPQAEPIPNGCNALEVTATVRNSGEQGGSAFSARAWLHAAAGSETSPGAIEARRSCGLGVLAPGAQGSCRFFFDLPAPLTLDPAALRVTVIARDDAGYGAPARLSAPAYGLDPESPVLTDLTVYGFPGSPIEVVPGRTHSIVAGVEDRYALDRWKLEWRARPNGAWQTIRENTLGGACRRSDGLSTSWTVPSGVAGGTDLDLRATAWDLSGRSAQKATILRARSTSNPTARFVAPAGGERFVLRTQQTPDACIPVDVAFVPGQPITEFALGYVYYPNGQFQADIVVAPIPADGRVRACVRSHHAGDQIRLAVQIRDVNAQEWVFTSEPVTVEFPHPPVPWRPAVVEPTQRLLPRPVGDFRSSGSSMSFSGLRAGADDIRMSRIDVRDWSTWDNATNEFSVQRLHFDAATLDLDATETVLPAATEPAIAGYGFGLSPVRYEEGFHLDHLISFLPPCTDPWSGARCTFEVRVREMVDGVLAPWRTLATYPDLLSTPVFEQPFVIAAWRGPSGAPMLAVRYGGDQAARTDIFRRGGDGAWLRLATHAERLRDVIRVGAKIWALRTATLAGGSSAVEALEIDETTGSIRARRQVLTFGEADVRSSIAKDPSSDHLVVLGYERTNHVTRTAELIGSTWTEHGPQPFPTTRRGRQITSVEVGFALLGGGQVYWSLQLSLEGGRDNVVVNARPGAGFALEEAFDDDWNSHWPYDALNNSIASQRIAADPAGDLVRIFGCQWNMEQRLCIQRAAPGVRTSCADDDLCTEDGWDPASGACGHLAVDCDAGACDAPRACDPASGACVPTGAAGSACDDGKFCNGLESCDPLSGSCSPGRPPEIDDGIACTRDECSETESAVVHVADDDACPGDACQVATCEPTSAGADPESGCVFAPRAVADDGLACTTDTCDSQTGRGVHVAKAGWCVIDRRCIADGTVNPAAPCLRCSATRDAGAWSPVADGQTCDDGQRCTVTDRCVAGDCAGVPRDCAAELGVTLDACTRALCDETSGTCAPRALPDGAACGDGDLCNGPEQCRAGVCRTATPLDCDDDLACTTDVCDAASGCENVPTADCQGSSSPARILISNAEVRAGSTAHVPVRLTLPDGLRVATLRFAVAVTPFGDALAPSGALSFAHCLVPPRAAPEVVSSGEGGAVNVAWNTALARPLTRIVQLGTLMFDVPGNARPGDRWVMSLRDISATRVDGTPVPLGHLDGAAIAVDLQSRVVFRADFEANNLCGWSGLEPGDGSLSTGKKAALGGRYGAQAAVLPGQSVFLRDDRPNGLRHYEARFVLDPNSVALAEGGSITVLWTKGRGAARPLALSLSRREGAYGLRAVVRPDSGRKRKSRWVAVADAPIEVGVVWHGASTTEASDGWAEVLIDGVVVDRLSGFATGDQTIEQERLGAIAVTDPTATGSIRFDDFESSASATDH